MKDDLTLGDKMTVIKLLGSPYKITYFTRRKNDALPIAKIICLNYTHLQINTSSQQAACEDLKAWAV